MSDLAELIREARRLSPLIDEGVRAMALAGAAEARAEFAYRRARAQAWVGTVGTAKEREDAVDAATAAERLDRDMARAEKEAAREGQRSRRAQLSACQTLVQAHKSEAEIAKYGVDH